MSNYREFLIPAILVLVGVVMLMAGRGGGRLGGRIALVILGAFVFIGFFFMILSLTNQE
ncbi:MAG TPA: hypothetical protein VEV82_09870 [Actinomycetota bacterium]|nr:hypothetical protein [Actinomycetota bacterium]